MGDFVSIKIYLGPLKMLSCYNTKKDQAKERVDTLTGFVGVFFLVE